MPLQQERLRELEGQTGRGSESSVATAAAEDGSLVGGGRVGVLLCKYFSTGGEKVATLLPVAAKGADLFSRRPRALCGRDGVARAGRVMMEPAVMLTKWWMEMGLRRRTATFR